MAEAWRTKKPIDNSTNGVFIKTVEHKLARNRQLLPRLMGICYMASELKTIVLAKPQRRKVCHQRSPAVSLGSVIQVEQCKQCPKLLACGNQCMQQPTVNVLRDSIVVKRLPIQLEVKCVSFQALALVAEPVGLPVVEAKREHNLSPTGSVLNKCSP